MEKQKVIVVIRPEMGRCVFADNVLVGLTEECKQLVEEGD